MINLKVLIFFAEHSTLSIPLFATWIPYCRGLINPDTHLGESACCREVCQAAKKRRSFSLEFKQQADYLVSIRAIAISRRVAHRRYRVGAAASNGAPGRHAEELGHDSGFAAYPGA